MLKQRIIFSLFFIYSSFLISEDDNVEVDLLFLKIKELDEGQIMHKPGKL